MKKIIGLLCTAVITTCAYSQTYTRNSAYYETFIPDSQKRATRYTETTTYQQNWQRPPPHSHSSNNEWIVPALIGGIVGYGLAQRAEPTSVYVPPPPPPPPPQIYEYRWVWDSSTQTWRWQATRIQ